MKTTFAEAMDALEKRIISFLEASGPQMRGAIQKGVRAKRERVLWALETLKCKQLINTAWVPHKDSRGRSIQAHLFFVAKGSGTEQGTSGNPDNQGDVL